MRWHRLCRGKGEGASSGSCSHTACMKNRHKKAGTPLMEDPASCGLDRPYRWWRWAELNRRPKALHPQHYMLSSPLNLVPEQHGVQSASGNQPVVF